MHHTGNVKRDVEELTVDRTNLLLAHLSGVADAAPQLLGALFQCLEIHTLAAVDALGDRRVSEKHRDVRWEL